MDNLLKLKQTLRERTRSEIPVIVVWATAEAVDWEKKTMLAIGVMDGVPYYDVLLGLGNKYVKPKVGSKCLLGLIENNDAAAFLIDSEEVEDIEWRISGKYLIANKTEDMLTLIKDLLDAIIAEKHMTNTGPTVKLTPESELRYQQLKTRFNTLLKSN